MDERDAINEERKIRFSVNPRWPLVSKKKKTFFPRGKRKRMGPSEISANRNRRDNGGKTAAAKFLP